MKAYVPGGSGFIGKSLIERMVYNGLTVRALAVSHDDVEILTAVWGSKQSLAM
jgi:nucleoside-diphosphate-sugar epimerase